MRFYVKGVGLVAPGLASWQEGRAVLAGQLPYQAQPLAAFSSTLLPPNERRRTTTLIKLALRVAEDALQGYPGSPVELASVFSSAEGDAEVADKICRTLLMPDRPVSPTQFHNSVHNAAAGYWAIASGSRCCSTSIAAGRESFSLGLMEAVSVALQSQQDVMLLAYDSPLPPPLQGRGYVDAPFAVALIISAQAGTGAWIEIGMTMTGERCTQPVLSMELQALRMTNPAAASLPLLALLAAGNAGTVSLPCGAECSLKLEVRPC